MNQSFRLVFGLNDFLLFLIGFGIGLGVFNHLLNIGIGQTTAGLNTNRLLFVGGFIFSRNINNTVGVNIKGYFNLRHTARCRRNTNQIKLAQKFVISRHFTFTLEDANRNRRLAVFGR